MEEETRKTGIDVIDAVPWGTHLCQFYDTKQDLVDILVPYFKAGLEDNEFCMWVTSEPLSVNEAEEAMMKTVPNFGQYLERKQIEIVPHTEWYLKDGAFNQRRVLNAWVDKLEQALANGYDGMRVTGNTTWLEKRTWRKFTNYEKMVDTCIGKYHILVICTYSLGKCGVNEAIDVTGNHQFTLLKRAGKWVLTKPRESQEVTSPAAPERPLTPLQQRFINSGFEGLDDRESIELLLGLVLPSRERKQLTKECVKKFGSLRRLLSASAEELQQVGITLPFMFCIKLIRELPSAILKQKLIERTVYDSSREIFDYLYYSMRDLKKEVFKVIYLNNRNQIIDTLDLFEGTVNGIHIHPREIEESAIKHNATALIFAHNHPSGDPAPSRTDKRLTRDMVFAGMILQINVVDHIIIGEDRYFSFADEGLIHKYEDAFLNLKIRHIPDSVYRPLRI